MKMTKIVIAALVIACLGLFMTACTKKEELKETTKEEISVEKEINREEASEKIFAEFTKVLEEKDLLKTKTFILANIQNVTKETADNMSVKYESLLKMNFRELADKCNSEKYFTAINETMDKEYVLNIEKIKDEKIKKEVMDMLASGYTFEMLEGSYYLTIDYGMIYDTFGEYLSEDIKPYYGLREKELEEPTFVEEYIGIDFEEIKNRAVTLEKVIRDNKEFENKEDLKDMMKWYVQALLSVDYIQNTVDYETGEVKEIVKKTYEELKESDLKIVKEDTEEMDKLLSTYNYILKPDNNEAYEKVYALKFKMVEEVEKKVEEYYLGK